MEIGLDRRRARCLRRWSWRATARGAQSAFGIERGRAGRTAACRSGGGSSERTRCSLQHASDSGGSRRSSRRRRRPTARRSRARARAGRRDRSGSPSCRRTARRRSCASVSIRSKSSLRDGRDEMVGAVALGDLLRRSADSSIGRVVEGDRAGVDRLARLTRPSSPRPRSNRRRPRGRRRAALPAIMRMPTASRSRSTSSSRLRPRRLVPPSSVNAHVPVLPRRRQRRAAAQRQACAPAAACATLRIDRARLGRRSQGEIFLDRLRIEVAPQPAVRQQRLELGAEEQRAVVEQRVVERLHAEAVAREEQRACGCGPTARTRTCRGSARRSPRPTPPRRGR